MEHLRETDVRALANRVFEMEATLLAQRAVIEVLVEANPDAYQQLIEAVACKIDVLQTLGEHADLEAWVPYERAARRRAVELLQEWLPLPTWEDAHGEGGMFEWPDWQSPTE